MAVIGEKELRTQLKSGALSHAYFIYGDEGYLKDHYIAQIKKKAVDPAFADFNIHIYEKDGTQLSDVLHDADTFPMMGGSNLVLVYDFPFDKKADVEDIKAYLKDVPDTTVLVFTYQSLPVDTKKEKRWNSIIKAFAKAGDAVELNTRTQSDLVKMLVSGAKAGRCVANGPGAIFDLCGGYGYADPAARAGQAVCLLQGRRDHGGGY